MSDQINEPAVDEQEEVSSETAVSNNDENPAEMSVNAASLAAAEPDAEPAVEPADVSADEELSVNASALASASDEESEAEDEAEASAVNAPGSPAAQDAEPAESAEPEGIVQRVQEVASDVASEVVSEAQEVVSATKGVVESATGVLDERETLAEAREDALAAGEAPATSQDEEAQEAQPAGVAEAEQDTVEAGEAHAVSQEDEEERRAEPTGATDEAEAPAENGPGEYIPDTVADEVPSGQVDVTGEVIETEAAALEDVEETGEAAAVTMPTSEEEADAEIEAAGVELVAEGRSSATVEVTNEGVAEDLAQAEDITEEGAAEEVAQAEEVTEERKGKRKRKKRARRKLETFEPGEELQGLVRSVQSYGAFVDVGAERDGLVHISELRDGFVEKVEDVVKEGEMVSVRVKDVDTERGRLSLTMRSEQAVQEEQEQKQRIRLRDLTEGQEFLGIVTSIVDFGAFVDIGARTDGLVHISELSEDRVNRVGDVVSEGEEVKVRVLNVDRKRNRISLSMREQVEAEDYTYEEEGDEEPPSLMELAFARARERSQKNKGGSAKGGKAERRNRMEDIIDRTLDQHGE